MIILELFLHYVALKLCYEKFNPTKNELLNCCFGFCELSLSKTCEVVQKMSIITVRCWWFLVQAIYKDYRVLKNKRDKKKTSGANSYVGEKHEGRLNREITSRSGWGSTSQRAALHSVGHQQGGARWRCTHPRSGKRPNTMTHTVCCKHNFRCSKDQWQYLRFLVLKKRAATPVKVGPNIRKFPHWTLVKSK